MGQDTTTTGDDDDDVRPTTTTDGRTDGLTTRRPTFLHHMWGGLWTNQQKSQRLHRRQLRRRKIQRRTLIGMSLNISFQNRDVLAKSLHRRRFNLTNLLNAPCCRPTIWI